MEPSRDKGTPGWHPAALDPPDEARTREIAGFMRAQHAPPEGYPRARDQFFHWKMRWNPVGPAIASAMIADDTSRIVSLCTVTPKRFWAWGEERLWGEIGDTFTDPAYQRRGMFVALANASRERAQRAGVEVIYGLPNEQSGPAYTGKLNFPIKADADHVNCTLPLSSRAVAFRSLAAHHGKPWYPVVNAALAHPASAAASRALAWALLARPRPAGVAVREESAFGAEFDALWRAVRPSLPVAQVRDARYLTWRFLESPFPFRVYVARRGGALAGYLVTLAQRDDHQTALRRLFLADWLFDPSETDSVGRALLQAALRPALDEGVDLVTAEAVRNGPVRLPLRHFGFLQRPWYKPLIIHRDGAGARALEDPSPWHFTLADTDAF